jgi:dynein heavy chain, axonemal
VLVDLPQNTNPLTLDKFVGMQEDFIYKKTDYMMSKNVEVERSVDDLI